MEILVLALKAVLATVVLSLLLLAETLHLTYTSDYRVKTNVQNYSGNASDKISALRLVSYTRTDFNVDVPIGFIAHELQEQMYQKQFLVTKDKEVAIGTLADYDGTELETSVVEPEVSLSTQKK